MVREATDYSPCDLDRVVDFMKEEFGEFLKRREEMRDGLLLHPGQRSRIKVLEQTSRMQETNNKKEDDSKEDDSEDESEKKNIQNKKSGVYCISPL